MSRRLDLGQFPSGDSSIFFNASEFAGGRWMVGVGNGGFGGGVVHLKGGDGTNYEAIQVLKTANATWRPLTISGASANLAIYFFECACSHLEFEMIGATAPGCNVYLFPRMRG